jgi:hypothetical protein
VIWRAQVGVDSVEAASSSQSTLSRDVNVNRALLLRKLDMIVSSVENLADGNAPSSKNADIFPRIGVSDVCRTDARNTLRKWMSGPALNKGLPCSNLLALSRKRGDALAIRLKTLSDIFRFCATVRFGPRFN